MLRNTLYEQDRILPNGKSVYQQALDEINHGKKQSHWMWYIFPSVCTVWGHSKPHVNLPSVLSMKDYIEHPILGLRLVQITEAVLHQLRSGISISTLMNGSPDDEKFRITMTAAELVCHYYFIHETCFSQINRMTNWYQPVADQFKFEVAQLRK